MIAPVVRLRFRLAPAAPAPPLVAWAVNRYNFMDGVDWFAGGMTVTDFTTLAAPCARVGACAVPTPGVPSPEWRSRA